MRIAILKSNLNIRARLVLGFAVLTFVLAAAVGTTLWEVRDIKIQTGRIVDLRVPTAFASSGLINDINASLAALRGWMLTGKPGFKAERAAVWAHIHRLRGEMDRLSASWTNPENLARWNDFKTILDEFEAAQKRVEEIAHTPEEQPATKLLVTEAAPRAAVIVKSITAMIDAETGLPATADRKALLGMMADVRGTMGLSLANIRAYLLTGDAKFKQNFDRIWAKNEQRFSDLSGNAHLLSPEQRAAFEELSEARGAFAPLPPEMFAIRGSEKWNMANYLLVAEAAPRAGKLLGILAGAKKPDGSRAGGMVDNQKGLLAGDAAVVAADANLLNWVEWILLAIGVAVGVFVTVVTTRSIVNPVKTMTDAMSRLAEGDDSVEVDTGNRSDELGRMAEALGTLRQAVRDAFRLKLIVEEMPSNIMTLDIETFSINYWNKASRQTLKSLEHLLPVKADEVLGQCIDIFHEDPERVRSIMMDPKNLPHRAVIQLGEERLDLKVNAINDKRGDYIGAMLSWEVKTEQFNLANSIQDVVEVVSSAANEMETTAQSMSATAEETSRQATAAAAGVDQASGNVQTVASASEELASSIAEVSRQVAQSAEVAKSAVDEAGRTNAQVESLVEAAQKIGDVVKLISDIAEQTNLLALNATIEAARAGEAGKGFAVVAGEVKSLASQTAKATEDIGAQIASIQDATTDAATAIKNIAATIGKVDEIAASIASAVEEQGAATQEIARNAQLAAAGSTEVSENVSGVTQAATETGAASTQVLESSKGLAALSSELSGQIDKFLQSLNAA